MTLPPCPHCHNQKQGVYRNVRAAGWCEEYFRSEDGKADMIATDHGLYFTRTSQKFYCCACGKVRKDLHCVNFIVVAKGGDE